MKIAILVPTTTNNTKFKNLNDTHLFKHLIPSLMNTLPENLQYSIYYAIDDNDKIYNKVQNRKKLLNSQYYKQFTNKPFKINMKPFILTTKYIHKGNVVAMWNMLFKKAYDDGCDYFFQTGDDIVFYQNEWLNICLKQIIANNNIGTSAPNDINNMRILTQSVVSRKHMEIFNYYFPPEIINWFCDDWINEVYKSINKLFTLKKHLCLNIGGNPRYDINNDTTFGNNYKVKFQNLKLKSGEVIKSDIEKLKKYIDNLK